MKAENSIDIKFSFEFTDEQIKALKALGFSDAEHFIIDSVDTEVGRITVSAKCSFPNEK